MLEEVCFNRVVVFSKNICNILPHVCLVEYWFLFNDFFNAYFYAVVYFFKGDIHIMCKYFALFFLLVLKVDLHGKFWDTLVHFIGS